VKNKERIDELQSYKNPSHRKTANCNVFTLCKWNTQKLDSVQNLSLVKFVKVISKESSTEKSVQIISLLPLVEVTIFNLYTSFTKGDF